MNYKESRLILDEIKKAKRILVNCHRGPDPDSIGCALSMSLYLESINKEVKIVCPSKELYENLSYLEGYKNIEKNVDFSSLDYSNYDLLITLDSSNWDQVTGNKKIVSKLKTIVIDHHKTNTNYGYINLVDSDVTSTGELLYLIFKDWNYEINETISNYLLVAIIGDTGAFRYPNSTQRTFQIATDLIGKGARKDEIIEHTYRTEQFNLIKFYGEVLTKLIFDKEGKFVWSAISYKDYRKFGKLISARESAAELFAQVVEGTDFGFLAVEQEKNILSVSFRSRTGFDTSKIAEDLGGGGHVYASGAKIHELPFNEAVDKLLETVRKYANINND